MSKLPLYGIDMYGLRENGFKFLVLLLIFTDSGQSTSLRVSVSRTERHSENKVSEKEGSTGLSRVQTSGNRFTAKSLLYGYQYHSFFQWVRAYVKRRQ